MRRLAIGMILAAFMGVSVRAEDVNGNLRVFGGAFDAGATASSRPMIADSGTPAGSLCAHVVAISGATGTGISPIVLTLPAGHGISTDNIVTVYGVAGNTAANGTWFVSASGATSIALRASTGNGNYSAGSDFVSRDVSREYFQTDATAGQNEWYCAVTGVGTVAWTQMNTVGGGPGGPFLRLDGTTTMTGSVRASLDNTVDVGELGTAFRRVYTPRIGAGDDGISVLHNLDFYTDSAVGIERQRAFVTTGDPATAFWKFQDVKNIDFNSKPLVNVLQFDSSTAASATAFDFNTGVTMTDGAELLHIDNNGAAGKRLRMFGDGTTLLETTHSTAGGSGIMLQNTLPSAAWAGLQIGYEHRPVQSGAPTGHVGAGSVYGIFFNYNQLIGTYDFVVPNASQAIFSQNMTITNLLGAQSVISMGDAGAGGSTFSNVAGFQSEIDNANLGGAMTIGPVYDFFAKSGIWNNFSVASRIIGFAQDVSSSTSSNIKGFGVSHDSSINDNKYLFWSPAYSTALTSKTGGIRINTTPTPDEMEFEMGAGGGSILQMTVSGPSNGKVSVKAGGSTGQIAKVGGTLNTDFTDHGSPLNGTADLWVYSVPGGTLNVNGEYLTFEAAGIFAATAANAKTLTAVYGATTLITTGSMLFSGTNWRITGTIVRVTGTTQRAIASFWTDDTLLVTKTTYTTPGETLSGSVNLKTRATGVSTNDVVNKLADVQFGEVP